MNELFADTAAREANHLDGLLTCLQRETTAHSTEADDAHLEWGFWHLGHGDHSLSSQIGWEGHRCHERILCLAGVEAGVLNDDGNVRFDDAREILTYGAIAQRVRPMLISDLLGTR